MGKGKTKFMTDNDKREMLFFVVSGKTNWGNEKGIEIKQEMTEACKTN